MAVSTTGQDPSDAKGLSSAEFGSPLPGLARPLKTPLTRKGMSPQQFIDAIDAIGPISTATLDAMEKAIKEGCGKATSHGG